MTIGMATLPDALRLGAVHLAVADADRAQTFYQDALGLQVHGREDGAVTLGAGAGDLVVLHEEPGARPAGRHAGSATSTSTWATSPGRWPSTVTRWAWSA